MMRKRERERERSCVCVRVSESEGERESWLIVVSKTRYRDHWERQRESGAPSGGTPANNDLTATGSPEFFTDLNYFFLTNLHFLNYLLR